MKTNFLWLAAIAGALVVGFWSGRSSDVLAPENSEYTRSEARFGNDTQSTETRGRRKRTSRVSGDGGIGELRASWLKDMEMAARMELLGTHSDPFSSDPFGGVEDESFGAFCAWALTARLGDFPDIMKYGETSDYDGSLGTKTKMLLRRWCRLDPAAALKWVGARQASSESDYWDGMDDRLWILKNSMKHHPAWAGRQLNELHQQALRKWEEDPRKPLAADEDPFGDRSKGEFTDHFEIGEFAFRLATLDASDQQEVMGELNFDLSEYDAGGYSLGLVLGESASLDVLAARAIDPATGVIDTGIFGAAVMKDWKKAHRWLSSQKGNQDLDSIVFSKWPADGQEEAESWYLSRATSQEDLADRVARVCSEGYNADECRQWVQKMEAKGMPVGGAWKVVYERMLTRDRFDDALDSLSKTSIDAKEREEKISGVYKEASNEHELWGGGVKLKFYAPKEQHAQFYQQHPEYYEFIKKHNAEQMEKFQKLGIISDEE